ncbi:MAG: hypothetical protein K5905_27555 [Roseibium sp.]|uniref:hypothetical protein n=1 Tax=Roseibium sp. TaxID=1936156 RepID=UPI00262A52BE|nr:hypothetical protein [Roseibium sp.]MCV0429224.1 hypothetical protein [Roseibium sp.]
MTRKRDAASAEAGKPFVLLETVSDIGRKGSIQTLTQTQADQLGAKIRPATGRDLDVAAKS